MTHTHKCGLTISKHINISTYRVGPPCDLASIVYRNQGRFTLWPKVKGPLISTNQIARNQEFGLSTLHTMAKVQRPLHFKMIPFWRRLRTLKGSLGRMGMETQTMVERPSVFFNKKFIMNKILAVRSEGLFWARNKVGRSVGFGLWAWPLEVSHYSCPIREAVGVHGQRFGLWAWPLEASHYSCPSQEAVGVHGQRFGLWAWPLEASHYARLKTPLPILYWLCMFNPFFLDSRQSLATQSHDLLTWTTIVWSGPC
jgi:hypothetical protein